MGHGASRMLTHATVLVNVPLADNIRLANAPSARTAVVRRGIPTTLNVPALDPVLMWDGRQQNLDAQALSAIEGHAAATRRPSAKELERIAAFERSRPFFTSPALWKLAVSGRPPRLPDGRTLSEKRGRVSSKTSRSAVATRSQGSAPCATAGRCSTRPTNSFPSPRASAAGAFSRSHVSELNEMGNPVLDFVFENPDGTTTLGRARSRPRADHGETGPRSSERLQDSHTVGRVADGAVLP